MSTVSKEKFCSPYYAAAEMRGALMNVSAKHTLVRRRGDEIDEMRALLKSIIGRVDLIKSAAGASSQSKSGSLQGCD